MHSGLRDTIRMIRDAGGTELRVLSGGKHARISFLINGRREFATLSMGKIASWRVVHRLRSQLRRKAQGNEARP